MNPEVNKTKDKFLHIGCIFISVSLVLNIVLLFLISGVRGELDRHNKILITLPPDLQNEISATFKQTASEIRSVVIKTTELTSAQIIADAEKKNTEALARIDTQMTKIIATQDQLHPELVKLNENIDSVVQTERRNHLNAEMAIGMAKKAVEQGELQLAMVYVLNAINHDSSNMEYIKFYNDLLIQKKDLNISDIDQFVNILDLAVFQVAASDVPDVVALKTAIMEKRTSMVLTEAETKSKEVAEAVATSIEELKYGRLAIAHVYSNGSINENLLKERLETLTALLADASLSQENQKTFTEDLSIAAGLYSIATTLSAVKNAIAKADLLARREQLSPVEILMARNQLQTANTLLSQIWSSDCEKYQDFMSVAQKLQGDIAEIDKKLNIFASTPAKERIELLIAECRNIANEEGKYTPRIDRIIEISKEFPQLLSSIYDPDLRKELAAEIESLSPIVTDLSKKRYKAYQEWVVERLNIARKKWDDSFRISEEEAKELFYDYLLEINPGLLLPDVNALYNNIYQLLYDKFSNKAWMQYLKATHKTRQLEDF